MFDDEPHLLSSVSLEEVLTEGGMSEGGVFSQKAAWPDGDPVIEMLSIKDICCGSKFVQRQLSLLF